MNKILPGYRDFFKDELGILEGFQITITIDRYIKSKFDAAGPVRYPLKDKTDSEPIWTYLNLFNTPLVAPIVPVMNNVGSIRICGGYEEILNQITSCV